METRLANIAIIVEKEESVERLNQILHKYGSYIIGRMGIPHKERWSKYHSIAIDAPQNEISSLSGNSEVRRCNGEGRLFQSLKTDFRKI